MVVTITGVGELVPRALVQEDRLAGGYEAELDGDAGSLLGEAVLAPPVRPRVGDVSVLSLVVIAQVFWLLAVGWGVLSLLR
jgi:hypothetical protein